MNPYKNPSLYSSRWRAAARAVLQRGFFRALVRSTITQHKIVHPKVKQLKGAFLVVANHSSHLDAPMIAQCLPFAQGRYLSTGVAREYFFDKWHRRIFVRSMFNAFPIDRDGSKKHSGISRTLLAAGVPVLVFPEGTRSTTGKIGTFKPGAAALAVSEGVPILPAAVIGAHEAMPKGRNWPRKGKPPVAVVFGEPIRAEQAESALALTARMTDAVTDLYNEHAPRILGTTGDADNPPE